MKNYRLGIPLTFVFLLYCCISISANNVIKKKKGKVEIQKVEEGSNYDKLFKEKHETAKGLFSLHKVKDKLYIELPLSLLNRDMLLGSTVSEVSDNGNAIIGSKPTDPIHFKFQKLNNKICINRVQSDLYLADNGQQLQAAIEKSTIGAILAAFPIAAYNKDSTTVAFDVSDYFVSDNPLLTPFDENSVYVNKTRKRTTNFQKSKSYIDQIKAFSDNVSIRSCLSYTYSITSTKEGTLFEDEPFTAFVTRSVMLLDSIPYRPRITDSRIAIFPTQKMSYSSTGQRAKIIYYANRWKLVPKDSAAFAHGEKVEPIKPIVFYVDSCFPDKWKKYIKEGVEQWNELFSEIGFKNAVHALDFPKNDTIFDPDNIKYSCIRYAPISIENAMGPSWIDPRSGEIISASVYVYHDVIKLLNNWLFVQTAQTDKRVRHTVIPEAIIGDALRYVISHEVGHCLGFMHNMSGSSVIPVDSLRSPSFTKKYGTTTSIMDYARFNYVAQPGDFEKGVQLTPPRFGIYDHFLIKWNYTPLPQAKTSQAEYAITSRWISELSDNPAYRYGKQQSEVVDPKSQTEDLGDDAIKASNYGIKNLKYILSNLNAWVNKEDSDYSYRKDIFNAILTQYYTYLFHVYGYIGGVYLNEKHVGDKVESLVSVPSERQKAAVAFMLNQLSSTEWLDNQSVLHNLPLVGSPADYMRQLIMKIILSAPEKVEYSALKSKAKNPYTMQLCMNDIYEYIWKPTIENKKLNAIQRRLQTLFVKQLASGAGIKFAKDTKSLAIDEQLQEHKDGCCLNDSRELNAYQSISGYNEPLQDYFVPKSKDSIYYGYYLRILKLLKSHIGHPDQQTSFHYQLLIHQMTNALN